MLRKERGEEKIIDGRIFSRCFLAGSMATTVFIIAFFAHNDMIALLMGIFLAWAILMVFDAILPYHKRFHGINGLAALALGVLAAIIFSPFQFIYFYFIIIVIASVVVYYRPVKNFISPKRTVSSDED